jgi:hypothetical protein
MTGPIEEVYFNWLYHKVASLDVPQTPGLTFYRLARALHSIEYAWLLPGDDNRVEDGIDLRFCFKRQTGISDSDWDWDAIPCSVLEMLIAFSNHAAFDTECYSEREWFWVFLENLEISDLSDNKEDIEHLVVSSVDPFVWRTYQFNGVGGIFPIDDTNKDQRKLEVWYQFCEYLIDKDLF